MYTTVKWCLLLVSGVLAGTNALHSGVKNTEETIPRAAGLASPALDVSLYAPTEGLQRYPLGVSADAFHGEIETVNDLSVKICPSFRFKDVAFTSPDAKRYTASFQVACNIDFDGNNLDMPIETILGPSHCAMECHRREKCMGAVFLSRSSLEGSSEGTCYLKDKLGEPTVLPGRISLLVKRDRVPKIAFITGENWIPSGSSQFASTSTLVPTNDFVSPSGTVTEDSYDATPGTSSLSFGPASAFGHRVADAVYVTASTLTVLKPTSVAQASIVTDLETLPTTSEWKPSPSVVFNDEEHPSMDQQIKDAPGVNKWTHSPGWEVASDLDEQSVGILVHDRPTDQEVTEPVVAESKTESAQPVRVTYEVPTPSEGESLFAHHPRLCLRTKDYNAWISSGFDDSIYLECCDPCDLTCEDESGVVKGSDEFFLRCDHSGRKEAAALLQSSAPGAEESSLKVCDPCDLTCEDESGVVKGSDEFFLRCDRSEGRKEAAAALLKSSALIPSLTPAPSPSLVVDPTTPGRYKIGHAFSSRPFTQDHDQYTEPGDDIHPGNVDISSDQTQTHSIPEADDPSSSTQTPVFTEATPTLSSKPFGDHDLEDNMESSLGSSEFNTMEVSEDVSASLANVEAHDSFSPTETPTFDKVVHASTSTPVEEHNLDYGNEGAYDELEPEQQDESNHLPTSPSTSGSEHVSAATKTLITVMVSTVTASPEVVTRTRSIGSEVDFDAAPTTTATPGASHALHPVSEDIMASTAASSDSPFTETITEPYPSETMAWPGKSLPKNPVVEVPCEKGPSWWDCSKFKSGMISFSLMKPPSTLSEAVSATVKPVKATTTNFPGITTVTSSEPAPTSSVTHPPEQEDIYKYKGGSDPQPDSEPDHELDPQPDSEPDLESDPQPDSIPDHKPDPQPESTIEAAEPSIIPIDIQGPVPSGNTVTEPATVEVTVSVQPQDKASPTTSTVTSPTWIHGSPPANVVGPAGPPPVPTTSPWLYGPPPPVDLPQSGNEESSLTLSTPQETVSAENSDTYPHSSKLPAVPTVPVTGWYVPGSSGLGHTASTFATSQGVKSSSLATASPTSSQRPWPSDPWRPGHHFDSSSTTSSSPTSPWLVVIITLFAGAFALV